MFLFRFLFKCSPSVRWMLDKGFLTRSSNFYVAENTEYFANQSYFRCVSDVHNFLTLEESNSLEVELYRDIRSIALLVSLDTRS